VCVCIHTLVYTLGVGQAEANHSWGGYHWERVTNPFTLELGDNVSGGWDSYLVQTSADWSLSTVLDTVIRPGNTNNTKGRNTPKNCTPTSGRAEICNAKYGSTGWLGIASIWTSGSHIAAGTVKMNDTYYATRPYNTVAWKNLVMCQEVGHIFGLAHQDENFDNQNLNTCMDYTNLPDSNQHPNTHDYAMLEAIYAHSDGTLPNGTTTPSLAPDSIDPKDWGKEVHRSENGRSSIFEEDLGNGNRILREVFWVTPRGHHHD
jgi:hypothetical protein